MSCIPAYRHHGAFCRTTTLPLLHPPLAEAHLLLVLLQASYPDKSSSLPHLLFFSGWFVSSSLLLSTPLSLIELTTLGMPFLPGAVRQIQVIK